MLFLLFYVLPVHTHTYDGLSYVLDVENGSLARLFHPHHLLYNPFCWLVWKAISSLVTVTPLAVMQTIGALATALAWKCTFDILRSLAAPRQLVWPLSMVAVLSYGPWRFSAITEPYALHLFLTAALFRQVSKLPPGCPSEKVLLEICLIATMATLNLQSACLFLLPALFIARGRSQITIKQLISVCCLTGTIVIIVYGICGFLVTNDLGAIPTWAARYSHDGRWWDPAPEKLLVAIVAASDSLLGSQLRAGRTAVIATGLQLASWLLGTILIAIAAVHVGSSLKRHRHFVIASSSSIVLHTLLFFQLDAGSPCYWTIIPFLCVLFLSAPLVAASETATGQRLTRVCSLSFAVMVMMSVFYGQILPQSRKDAYRPYHIARQVAATIPADGRLWLLGGNVQERVFRLFYRQLSLLPLHDYLLDEQLDTDSQLVYLTAQFNEDLRQRKVYLYRDVYDGQVQTLRGRDGQLLARAKVAKIFAAANFSPQLATKDGTVYLWRARPKR